MPDCFQEEIYQATGRLTAEKKATHRLVHCGGQQFRVIYSFIVESLQINLLAPPPNHQ